MWHNEMVRGARTDGVLDYYGQPNNFFIDNIRELPCLGLSFVGEITMSVREVC